MRFDFSKDRLELKKLEEILNEINSEEIWNIIKVQILLSYYRKRIKKRPNFGFIKKAVKDAKIMGEK
jgi:hypothetical protein